MSRLHSCKVTSKRKSTCSNQKDSSRREKRTWYAGWGRAFTDWSRRPGNGTGSSNPSWPTKGTTRAWSRGSWGCRRLWRCQQRRLSTWDRRSSNSTVTTKVPSTLRRMLPTTRGPSTYQEKIPQLCEKIEEKDFALMKVHWRKMDRTCWQKYCRQRSWTRVEDGLDWPITPCWSEGGVW